MSLSRASFELVRTLLRERSGQILEDDKVYLVETRLLAVAGRHGFQSVENLVLDLRARRREPLVTEIVEAMLIHETSFFRDEEVFNALREFVLPDLVRQRAHLRCLRIWSACCSSGQEPYSLVMMLFRHFPMLAGWNIQLLASDISAQMLTRARRGLYSDLEISRGVPAEMRDRYFQKHANGWQLRDELRQMVEFRQINLSGPWPELGSVDLLLLRNVLIYFDTPSRRHILSRVRQVLHPNGYLVLGGAETTYSVDDQFIPVAVGNVSLFQLRASTSLPGA